MTNVNVGDTVRITETITHKYEGQVSARTGSLCCIEPEGWIDLRSREGRTMDVEVIKPARDNGWWECKGRDFPLRWDGTDWYLTSGDDRPNPVQELTPVRFIGKA